MSAEVEVIPVVPPHFCVQMGGLLFSMNCCPFIGTFLCTVWIPQCHCECQECIKTHQFVHFVLEVMWPLFNPKTLPSVQHNDCTCSPLRTASWEWGWCTNTLEISFATSHHWVSLVGTRGTVSWFQPVLEECATTSVCMDDKMESLWTIVAIKIGTQQVCKAICWTNMAAKVIVSQECCPMVSQEYCPIASLYFIQTNRPLNL